MTSQSFNGLSKLEGFSCDVQISNDEDKPRNCMLNFKIINDSKQDDVKLSISKPNLDVLLDGLHKIQDQLTNVATKIKS